jgi:Holliday junction DNA helicase RuvB
MARPPKTFNEFIGQPRLIRHLARKIAGAKELGRACPSMLLAGPSGVGKTTLAEAIARECGTDILKLFAGEDTTPLEVCRALGTLQANDVFFIDEIHALTAQAQQILYVALDDRKAPACLEGRLDRTTFESVAEFTLIGATNEPGRLKRALRRRLTRIEFDRYSIAELKLVAVRLADRDGVEISPQAARRLAETAQGTPALVQRRVDDLRLYWPEKRAFTVEDVVTMLSEEGIDHHGLSAHQRQYLTIVAESPHGTCSLERISVRLGCDLVSIKQDLEPFLIEEGLVDPHSARGRKVTAKGRTLTEEFAPVAIEHDEVSSC